MKVKIDWIKGMNDVDRFSPGVKSVKLACTERLDKFLYGYGYGYGYWHGK